MSVDKSEVRVRRMFGQIAPRYDLLNHLLSLGIDVYWRSRAVRRAPPQGDFPVLDLCTGTGDLALAYWRAGKGQIPVVGADFCRPMLAVGHEKARRAGATGLEFFEADAQKLPFADSCFQIVSVSFGLRNVTDTDRGLREMLRVCRPGGRIVVLEFSMPRTHVLGKMYDWYFRYVLPRVGQTLARNRDEAYHYLPQSVSEFPSGERLADRMRAAGASDVRYWPLTFGVATLYVGTK
jgi:demethylmenaquinone methyltransferase / 2-methoxy-6-polyprenyl-1,4-benzoquinol methylase